MTRWKAICTYDGTDFFGWQSQVGGNTIQDILEAQLKAIFKKPLRIHGSSRTDAGVHAKAQVFHFDADWAHSPEKLFRAIACGLPDSIQIASVRKAPNTFHARYSATGKRYIYRFYEGYAPPMETRYYWSLGNQKLDLEAMREAANRLLGQHDFSAFRAARSGGNRESPVKDLRRLDIIRHGPRIRLITEASGYLYKMVRSLAGTLVDVGLGKLSPAQVSKILKSRKRTRLVVTAPAKGLILDKVFCGGKRRT